MALVDHHVPYLFQESLHVQKAQQDQNEHQAGRQARGGSHHRPKAPLDRAIDHHHDLRTWDDQGQRTSPHLAECDRREGQARMDLDLGLGQGLDGQPRMDSGRDLRAHEDDWLEQMGRWGAAR